MKNKKIGIIILVIVLALCVGVTVGVKYYLDKDLENQKQELQETIDKYGTVEKESVMLTVSKFNTQVKENGSEGLNVAMDDYSSVEGESYCYGLVDGIYLYAKPLKFTGDKEKDETDYMTIYYKKDVDEKIALEYVRHLISANGAITAEEADTMIAQAKELAPDGKTANNGKGISVGCIENDDNFQYQVIRIYK